MWEAGESPYLPTPYSEMETWALSQLEDGCRSRCGAIPVSDRHCGCDQGQGQHSESGNNGLVESLNKNLKIFSP